MATSFLPFLYPARLVQRPPRGPVVRHLLRSLHATALRPERQRQQQQQQQQQPMIRRPARRDPIPFELPPDIERDLLPDGENEVVDGEEGGAGGALDDGKGRISIGGGGAEGTITPLERQAFRRIFREISQRQKYGGGGIGNYGVEDYDDGAYDGTSFLTHPQDKQRARINTIVSEASDDQVLAREHQRNQRRQDEEDGVLGALGSLGETTQTPPPLQTDVDPTSPGTKRNRVLAQFPASLRSAAGKAMGVKDEARQAQLAAREDERQAPEGMETATPTATPPLSAAHVARRKRQEKMELAMLSKKSDVALWQYMEEHVFALVDEFGIGREQQQREQNHRATATTKATSKATPARQRKLSAKLTAYGPLYPALLLHGLRLLDSHFDGGTTSPLALAVLPRIKALGLASYVLGASTPLYNHLLRIRWTRQGDAAAVFALLQEMQRAGLAFDQGTLDVVKSIEWHVVPLAGGGMGMGMNSAADGAGNGGNAFVAAALQKLPDLAAVPSMAAYWRQQVERTVNWGRRG